MIGNFLLDPSNHCKWFPPLDILEQQLKFVQESGLTIRKSKAVPYKRRTDPGQGAFAGGLGIMVGTELVYSGLLFFGDFNERSMSQAWTAASSARGDSVDWSLNKVFMVENGTRYILGDQSAWTSYLNWSSRQSVHASINSSEGLLVFEKSVYGFDEAFVDCEGHISMTFHQSAQSGSETKDDLNVDCRSSKKVKLPSADEKITISSMTEHVQDFVLKCQSAEVKNLVASLKNVNDVKYKRDHPIVIVPFPTVSKKRSASNIPLLEDKENKKSPSTQDKENKPPTISAVLPLPDNLDSQVPLKAVKAATPESSSNWTSIDISKLDENKLAWDYIIANYLEDYCKSNGFVKQHLKPREKTIPLFQFDRPEKAKDHLKHAGYATLGYAKPVSIEEQRLLGILRNRCSGSPNLLDMLGTSYQDHGVKGNHKLVNIQLFGEWRSSFECQLTDLFNVRAEVKTQNYHPFVPKHCATQAWTNCYANQSDPFATAHLTIYVCFSESRFTVWPKSHILNRRFFVDSEIKENYQGEKPLSSPVTFTVGAFQAVVVQSDLLHHISPWRLNEYVEGGYLMLTYSVKDVSVPADRLHSKILYPEKFHGLDEHLARFQFRSNPAELEYYVTQEGQSAFPKTLVRVSDIGFTSVVKNLYASKASDITQFCYNINRTPGNNVLADFKMILSSDVIKLLKSKSHSPSESTEEQRGELSPSTSSGVNDESLVDGLHQRSLPALQDHTSELTQMQSQSSSELTEEQRGELYSTGVYNESQQSSPPESQEVNEQKVTHSRSGNSEVEQAEGSELTALQVTEPSRPPASPDSSPTASFNVLDAASKVTTEFYDISASDDKSTNVAGKLSSSINYGSDLHGAFNKIIHDAEQSKNDVIQRYEALSVVREHFMRVVNGNELIHDEIIDIHLQMLGSYFHDDEVVLLPTQFMKQSYKFDGNIFNEEFMKSRYSKMFAKKVKEIVVPINHASCHWVLLIVEMETKALHWWESLTRTEETHAYGRKYMSVLKRFLLLRMNIPEHQWVNQFHEEAPKQQGVDCALHVICNARKYFKYPHHHPFDQARRDSLCLDILRGKLI